MKREPRRNGPVLLAGLGGFVLGAATVLFVVWGYGIEHPLGGGAGAPAANPAATTAPAVPGASEERVPRPPLGTPAIPGRTPTSPAPRPTPGPAAPNTEAVPTPASPGAESPAAPASPTSSEVADLLGRHLLLPVQGIQRSQLTDTFTDNRGDHSHQALDIMAQRNTPVLAVEDGKLVKLFFSRLGGNTIYQFDPNSTYAYYYAHLERYADGLREGDMLRRGQVIGYVGTSGDAPANAPHLHFAIFQLTAEKHWWQGTAINPFPILRQP